MTTVNQNTDDATLFITDLHPTVDQTVLFELCKSFGEIKSVRVCRDIIRNNSLGYAYVNFSNKTDAKSAMDNLNFQPIHGQPCRIMWSERNSTNRKSNIGNIFIKNLDLSVTAKELHDIFAEFGEITSCRLKTDKDNGTSLGYGYISYSDVTDSEKAIEIMNGKCIKNKLIQVEKFVPQIDRMSSRKSTITNCFIKNFGVHLNNESLRELFEPFGEIISAKVMTDESGVSKGFGFVSFRKFDDAIRAIQTLNGKLVSERLIYVGLHTDKRRSSRDNDDCNKKSEMKILTNNVFIKNLDLTVNDDKLKEEFSSFGKITSAKVMLNENNTSKGFGFVCFSSPTEAQLAVNEMNNKSINGKTIIACLARKKDSQNSNLTSE